MDQPITKQPTVVERSESIKELVSALSKFQGKVKNATKEASNPFFKSKYATLDSIVDVIKEPLAENGLSYMQFPIGTNILVTILAHSSGEYISSSVEMTPKDSTPQAHGSAITYMRRYCLSSILGIATEDDDDGNAASTGTKHAKPAVVVRGKVDSQDAYAEAVKAIDKAKTQGELLILQERVENSVKLSDGQKDELDKIISSKVDLLESQS